MRELSGLWALLPVIVWQEMHLGALGYGLLLGCIGVGAVLGAAALPQVQRKIPIIDQQVIISTIALALVMIALGYLRNLLVLCLIATVSEIAWIMLVSSFGWFLARGPSDVLSHIETFMAESWEDYLRQLERMTNADHAIEKHARTFHQGSAPPTVTLLIAEHPNWQGAPERVG